MKIRLTVNWKELLVGQGVTLAGLLVCLLLCQGGTLKAMVLGAWLLASIQYLRIEIENRYFNWAAVCAIVLFCAVLDFLLVQMSMELIHELGVLGEQGAMTYLLNILCSLMVMAGFYALLGSIRGASLLTFLLTLGLSSANFYVIQFRGSEMKLSDFLAIGAAANVIGSYQFQILPVMIYSWFVAAAWHLFLFRNVRLRKPRPGILRKVLTRLAALLAAAACALTIAGNQDYLRRSGWLREDSWKNGFLFSFFSSTPVLEKPEDYGGFDIAQMEAQYPADPDTGRRPHVIVIMNECFSDLRVYNGSLNTNVPVMPFYDTLKENAVKGYALASIYGGGTSNSEYEVLTGNTLAFLPRGTHGYQQYVREDTYTLNAYFRSLGYHTVAMHPAPGNGWMRSTVWNRMQFDQVYFQEEDKFFGEEQIRGFTPDRAVYKRVLETLENQEEGKPLFLFGVTIQNHGGYQHEGYTPSLSLEGYSKPYPELEQYLSLVRESDAALAEFIAALEAEEEEVVLLFYGDHQPRVDSGFFPELNGGALDSLDERQQMYTVPFMVWANYDIAEAEVEMTSLNYLGGYLLEAAGLPLPSYVRYLRELEKIIPAINLFGYRSNSAEGGYSTFEDAQGAEKEALARYRCLQYHSIKGGKNRSQVFFPSAE